MTPNQRQELQRVARSPVKIRARGFHWRTAKALHRKGMVAIYGSQMQITAYGRDTVEKRLRKEVHKSVDSRAVNG